MKDERKPNFFLYNILTHNYSIAINFLVLVDFHIVFLLILTQL